MNERWSAPLARSLHLRLPADVVHWLDQERWKIAGGAEFDHPREPATLPEPEPGVLWGGFMLPDTLPLIGNNYGDWLCLRIAPEGAVREVVYWNHAGGDWIPYGDSLAEALLYDAARAYGRMAPGENGEATFRQAEWALDWVPRRPARFWPRDAGAADPVAALTEAGLATVAVCRDRAEACLANPLKTHASRGLASELSRAWDHELVRWMFDTSLLPESMRELLSQRLQISPQELLQQDWNGAEAECLAVLAERKDLGWACDLAGWAAERRGDLASALPWYLAGVRASQFADDTVRFRTHWFPPGYGKFAAARLAEHRGELSPEIRRDAYLNTLWENDPESLRARIRDHWLTLARAAHRAGQFAEAYRCYYSAGWDLGLQFVESYVEILDGLVASAAAAQWPALAAVARLHRQSLP